MNFRRLVVFAALVAAPPLAAQQIGQLPRITPTTGLADSALFMCTDSTKAVTRACKFSLIQTRLAFKAWDSVLTARLNLTGGTITGSPTWSSTFTAASGQRVDSATGSARAQILTTARTIGGTSFNGSANIVPGLADSATGATRAQKLTTARTIGGTSFDGTANITPALADSATGATRAQKLTTARTIGGVSFDGTANITPDSATGAARAQVLTTARTIGGTSFNGSANITPGLADSATGAVRAQTLTTARTIGGVSFNGSANILPDSAVGAARASALVGSPAITVSSCTGCGGGVVVRDTVKLVTFDSVRATRMRADTISASAGASKTLTLQSWTSGSVRKNTLVLNADSSVSVLGGLRVQFGGTFTGVTQAHIYGSSSGTGIAFNPVNGNGYAVAVITSTALRWYWDTNGHFQPLATNTLDIGTSSLAVRTVYARAISGDAASMNILAGTGNNRTLTFQSSNSSGTATTFASGAGDTLKLTAHAKAAGLTAAPSTSNSMCLDATSKEVYENAASSCLVSSIRYKKDVNPLPLATARDVVMGVKPVTFAYKIGGVRAIGAIAEQADSVDSRLVSRDKDDRPNSINYEQITASLLKVVQEHEKTLARQQKTIDSLVSALKKPGRGSPDSLTFNYQAELMHANIAVTVTPDGSVVYAPGTTLESLKPVFRALATPSWPILPLRKP